MANKQESLGIRNNNPGNIRYNGTAWKGLANPPSDGAFCIFATPRDGIRALARILRIYQSKHGICTIAGVINRWAPSIENETTEYVHSVCKQTGFAANARLDFNNVETLAAVVKAIIRHENGKQPYTDGQILEGIKCSIES
jgi:hypothetical protein